MNKLQNYLDEMFVELKDKIYSEICLIDMDNFNEMRLDLLNLNEYIPNLLRKFLGLEYYSYLDEKDDVESIFKLILENRKQSNEEDVIELINWVDSHKEFSDLLDEEKVVNLGNRIEFLESEYELYYEILK